MQQLAKALDDSAMLRWSRLELEGYVSSNPAIGDDVEVPEYRTVSGQYYDDWGRPLVVNDPKLDFIHHDRLRFGVPELERLASRDEEVRVKRTAAIDIVRKNLRVDVTTYGFHSTLVTGILTRIRARAIDLLADVERQTERRKLPVASSPPEVLTASNRRAWLREHLVPVVLTVGGGLVVAFLAHYFGWV